jgi:tRNA A37 threonylcarbamoyladenosine modification protein TsaB
LKGSARVTGTIAPFLDARRGQLFGSLYRPTGTNGSLQLISEETILTVEEFVEIVKGNRDGRNTILVSPTPEILPAENLKASLPETEIETVSAVLAPTIGHLGFDLALRGDLVDALSLDANYVRRSDAESRWKDE